jgi:ribosomal protein S18 acetylase RimI-like enzyme
VRGGAPRVRPAAPPDADAIAAVWVRSWQTAYRGLVPDAVLDALSLDERRGLWRDRLARGEPALVAELDGAVAGYCRVLCPSRDEDAGEGVAEIASLYVHPSRRGIGSALLRAALQGRREVTLWVFTENHAARAFYARFGFAPDGAVGFDEKTGLHELRLRAGIPL